MNTKFCYYNNYNKSQPRHFCKSCKRHWTKGGTLRNVPVGGCRKNRRLRKLTTTAAAAAVIPTISSNNLDSQSFNSGFAVDSSLLISQNQDPHFFSARFSSIEENPSPISTTFGLPHAFEYSGESETTEDIAISSMNHPYQVPTGSSVVDMSSYWSRDWFDEFLTSDLNLQWDDPEIKL